MKNKLYYRFWASTCLLVFILLGYIIKFYPQNISGFDTSIQSEIFSWRNPVLTNFLKLITSIGNIWNITFLVILIDVIFYFKKWYAELIYLSVLFVMVPGVLVAILKKVYQRPRPPEGSRLITETNFSFPSGHATVSMTVFFILLLIFLARIEQKYIKIIVATFLISLILLIGFSRVYLGVHFPSDILGGYTLALGFILLAYPYYDLQRFTWRFKGRQK
jgi:Membrane-associated phospholipid phosphatase